MGGVGNGSHILKLCYALVSTLQCRSFSLSTHASEFQKTWWSFACLPVSKNSRQIDLREKKKLLWRPINLDFIAALYLAFKSWEKSEGVCHNNPHLWPKVHRYTTWGLTLQYFYGTFYWKLTFQKKSVEICFRVIYCKWPIIYTITWHFFCACQHFCLKSGALIGIGLDR